MTASPPDAGSRRGHLPSPRWAEIRVGSRPLGTGYYVTGNLVLTASHVSGDDVVSVRAADGDDWVEAAAVWRSSDWDLLLLRTANYAPHCDEWDQLTWGNVDPGALVTMAGMPYARQRDGAQARWMRYWAVVTAGPDQSDPRFAMTLTNAGHDALAGLSGAAVLGQGGEFLGVVTGRREAGLASEAEREAVLAVPVAPLLADRDFASLVQPNPAASIETTVAAPMDWPLAAVLVGARGTVDRTTSISDLLQPWSAVVPFVDRVSEMHRLLDWCESPEAVSVTVLVGSAGVGKTRLAVALCERLSREGWDAGFVNLIAWQPGRHQTGRRTLAVVDYAETIERGQIASVVDTQGPAPLRVLLLVRSTERLRSLLTTGPWRTAQWMNLSGLPRSDAVRLARSASEALGRITGRASRVDTFPDRLWDALAGTPLDIHLWALTNLDGGGLDPENVRAPNEFRATAVRLLIQRWTDTGPKDSAESRTTALAVTVLVRPTRDEVAGLLFDARLLTEGTEVAVVKWLESIFGMGEQFDAYLPDLLVGELARLTGEPSAAFGQALRWIVRHPRAATNVLGSLSRLVAEGPDLLAAAVQAFGQQIETLARLAAATPQVRAPLVACVDAIEAVDTTAPVEAWRAFIRQARGLGGVGFAGMGDRFTRSDRLGRGPLVDGIFELLAPPDAVVAREPIDEDAFGPSVIAVDGPWGSGKTSLMRIVQTKLDGLGGPSSGVWRRLVGWLGRRWRARRMTVLEAVLRLLWWRDRPTPAKPGVVRVATTSVVTVWFNPWAHQSSEQVWAGLARVILDAVQPRLCPSANEKARYWLRRNAARVDRSALRRTLLRRVQSPLLRLGVIALLPPVAAALLRYDKTFHLFGEDRPATLVAVVVAVGVLLLATVHTAWRLLAGNVIAYCPAGLLDAPVLSGALADSSAESGIRDPLRHARSGYLYLHQHDIHQLLEDAEQRGMGVVVFIDDLDRCSPQTTAEVLGAVNLFLSEAFPSARFILGLDTAVVANHIDQAMKGAVSPELRLQAGDPSLGWTFLRKLVQLPVTLPRTSPDKLEKLLVAFLGEVQRDLDETRSSATSGVAPQPPVTGTGESRLPSEAALDNPHEVRPPSLSAPPAAATGSGNAAAARAAANWLEQNPEIRQYIRERLDAWTNPSVRDVKRFLTVWQFYIRMLSHPETTGPLTGIEQVRRGRAAILLAEIVVRWPAYLNQLLAVRERRQVLGQLVDAARADDGTWTQTAAKLGFDQAKARQMSNALRKVLREADAPQAANLAELLF